MGTYLLNHVLISKIGHGVMKNMVEEGVAYKTPYFSFAVETMYFNVLGIQ